MSATFSKSGKMFKCTAGKSFLRLFVNVFYVAHLFNTCHLTGRHTSKPSRNLGYNHFTPQNVKALKEESYEYICMVGSTGM